MAWLERIRAMKAERLLEGEKIRNVFPTFSLLTKPFTALYETGYGNKCWMSKKSNVLGPHRHEIDATVPAGTLIALPITWEAKLSAQAHVFLDGRIVPFHPNLTLDETVFLAGVVEYPFVPKMLGENQTLEFRMWYKDLKQSSYYQVQHGKLRLSWMKAS